MKKRSPSERDLNSQPLILMLFHLSENEFLDHNCRGSKVWMSLFEAEVAPIRKRIRDQIFGHLQFKLSATSVAPPPSKFSSKKKFQNIVFRTRNSAQINSIQPFRHLAMGIKPLPLHTWVFNAPIHYSLLLQVSPVRIAFLDLWWVVYAAVSWVTSSGTHLAAKLQLRSQPVWKWAPERPAEENRIERRGAKNTILPNQ